MAVENLKRFNKIYDETYFDILKYVIIKCHNINDANDIIQDVYLEFWKILNKKDIEYTNINSYLIGIAINKIKKHYALIQRIKSITLFNTEDTIDNIKSNINIESIIINNEDWDSVWNFIKCKKNQDIPKIFYLYYKLEMTIKDIAKELDVTESYVKNLIYRTLKELNTTFGKECD